MARPRIAVFSGPTSTIANSPTLVTSNKGRLAGDRVLSGRYDHLVGQSLHEPVTVRIRKYSAHPLEEDAKHLYHDDGKEYYEVELRPEDGPYLFPYMGRRADSSANGVPFEDGDLESAALKYGGRQFFYPDASRIFTDIDRTIAGRDDHGEGSILDRLADYDFIRALPPGGYTQKGEVLGVDYFPYKPWSIGKTPRLEDAARIANAVQSAMDTGNYAGGIWLQGSPTVEETIYWLSLLIDTEQPLVGISSQRPHGQLANDGDRNIVDAVEFILSGLGSGLGGVGIVDQQIFASREFKKGDARPGGYKATGGHGGVLGTIGPPITVWYKPAYKQTSTSDVNLRKLPSEVEFLDAAGDTTPVRVPVKNADGSLRADSIPRVHIAKYGLFMEVDEKENPDYEVDILARIEAALQEQVDPHGVKLHGLVLEGQSPFATGSRGQMAAMSVAAFSGLPVVMVGRADPSGRAPLDRSDIIISGSNLDATKARLLLMASMLKLGRLPKAKDPRNPTSAEQDALKARVAKFQEIIEAH